MHALIGGICEQLTNLQAIYEDGVGSESNEAISNDGSLLRMDQLEANMGNRMEEEVVNSNSESIVDADDISNRVPLTLQSTENISSDSNHAASSPREASTSPAATPFETTSTGITSATPVNLTNSPNIKTFKSMLSAQSFVKDLKSVSDGLYLNETFSLMLDRWEKLNKDFLNAVTGIYDLTKVPDVYGK